MQLQLAVRISNLKRVKTFNKLHAAGQRLKWNMRTLFKILKTTDPDQALDFLPFGDYSMPVEILDMIFFAPLIYRSLSAYWRKFMMPYCLWKREWKLTLRSESSISSIIIQHYQSCDAHIKGKRYLILRCGSSRPELRMLHHHWCVTNESNCSWFFWYTWSNWGR